MCHTAQFKGSSFTLTVLQLYDNDLERLSQSITEKVNQAPAFFAHAPIVLDVSNLPLAHELDFIQAKQLIEQNGMVAVAVTGCPNQRWQQQAQLAGLAIVTAARQQKTQQAHHRAAKVIRHPVRSGQQIYANNCDLVVMNHVSAGAELIADGSIHIYGTLRGRAIAGASGNCDAQIYCEQIDAELLSIAGNYWLNDAIPQHYHQQAVVVYYQDNQLHIEQLRDN